MAPRQGFPFNLCPRLAPYVGPPASIWRPTWGASCVSAPPPPESRARRGRRPGMRTWARATDCATRRRATGARRRQHLEECAHSRALCSANRISGPDGGRAARAARYCARSHSSAPSVTQVCGCFPRSGIRRATSCAGSRPTPVQDVCHYRRLSFACALTKDRAAGGAPAERQREHETCGQHAICICCWRPKFRPISPGTALLGDPCANSDVFSRPQQANCAIVTALHCFRQTDCSVAPLSRLRLRSSGAIETTRALRSSNLPRWSSPWADMSLACQREGYSSIRTLAQSGARNSLAPTDRKDDWLQANKLTFAKAAPFGYKVSKCCAIERYSSKSARCERNASVYSGRFVSLAFFADQHELGVKYY